MQNQNHNPNPKQNPNPNPNMIPNYGENAGPLCVRFLPDDCELVEVLDRGVNLGCTSRWSMITKLLLSKLICGSFKLKKKPQPLLTIRKLSRRNMRMPIRQRPRRTEELEDASEAAAEEDGNEVDDNATLTRLQHTSHVVLRAQEQEQEQADSDDSDGEKQDFKVGMQVYLKNISKSRIAKGKVVKELNHGSVVGDRKLGRDWCEVSIEIAIRRTEELLRKHSGLKTIEDAIGSAVVWPCSLIYPVVPEFDEEDDG